MTQPDGRIDRLRELSAELSAPVSTPDGDAGDELWDPWMDAVSEAYRLLAER